MENNQENISPIIPPEPPKSLDKKWIVLVIIALVGSALVYIFYPKNITSCGVLPNGPSCAQYMCWGIPMQGIGKPLCLGKLKLVGPATLPQQNQTQDISNDWKIYKDEINGFEFQYPSNWEVDVEHGWIRVLKYGSNRPVSLPESEYGLIDGAQLGIDISSEPIKIIEEDEKFFAYGFNGFVGNDAGDGRINDEYLEAQYLLNNGKYLYIEWQRADPNITNDLSYKKYLLPILSTFKFTSAQSKSTSAKISLSADKKTIISDGKFLLAIDEETIFNFFKTKSQLCDGYNITTTPTRKMYCENKTAFKNETRFKSIIISPDGKKIGFTIESDTLSPDTVVGIFYPYNTTNKVSFLSDYYLGNEFLSFSPNGTNFVYSGGCWEAICAFYIKDSGTLKDKINFIPAEADMRGNYEFVRWISDNEIEYKLDKELKRVTLKI